MGRIVTPKYRVEVNTPGWAATPGSWRVKEHGAPTAANLTAYVMAYAKSLEPGGQNAHIVRTFGELRYPSSARIVEQKTGRVVVEWRAGIFQTFGPLSGAR